MNTRAVTALVGVALALLLLTTVEEALAGSAKYEVSYRSYRGREYPTYRSHVRGDDRDVVVRYSQPANTRRRTSRYVRYTVRSRQTVRWYGDPGYYGSYGYIDYTHPGSGYYLASYPYYPGVYRPVPYHRPYRRYYRPRPFAFHGTYTRRHGGSGFSLSIGW
jgi:hypothetical protein